MYIIQIRKKALKEIKIIPSPYKQNIIKAIDELANNPRPAGCIKNKRK
jgi:mRNA-degrading endonuclease RelE of RelBE toxin-antitoxin system